MIFPIARGFSEPISRGSIEPSGRASNDRDRDRAEPAAARATIDRISKPFVSAAALA
jgi:hypothetical protein